jgi:hypothetical protein
MFEFITSLYQPRFVIKITQTDTLQMICYHSPLEHIRDFCGLFNIGIRHDIKEHKHLLSVYMLHTLKQLDNLIMTNVTHNTKPQCCVLLHNKNSKLVYNDAFITTLKDCGYTQDWDALQLWINDLAMNAVLVNTQYNFCNITITVKL